MQIDKTVIIEGNVHFGKNVFIGPYTIIYGPAEIGDNVKIHGHVSIGDTPQHRTRPKLCGIEIGDNTTIREFATIHAGTENKTRIGKDCYLMNYSHISHDSVVEDNVTLANSVQLGGHSYVMKGATIGLGATVHQYSLIGSYSMVGMNSVVGVKCRITPGKIFAGNPARSAGSNVIGLSRNAVSNEYLIKETERFWYILDGD